jgi:hypothetical protein
MVMLFLQQRSGLVLKPEQERGLVVEQSLTGPSPLLAQGQTHGSTLQQCTNKTLTTSPFDNTCEVDEVSPEVEAGVIIGLKCLQP